MAETVLRDYIARLWEATGELVNGLSVPVPHASHTHQPETESPIHKPQAEGLTGPDSMPGRHCPT